VKLSARWCPSTRKERRVAARLAEDREEVVPRVAEAHVAAARAHSVLQHRLERHHAVGLQVPLRREAGVQQRLRRRLLRVAHRAEREALALARDEVPVEAASVVERELRERLVRALSASRKACAAARSAAWSFRSARRAPSRPGEQRKGGQGGGERAVAVCGAWPGILARCSRSRK
jgi:hypothetical protein